MGDNKNNQPLGGNEQPRFSGSGTFMRLPSSETAKDLDVAFLGIPMDIGTSWRSGTRFGPKQIRAESNMLRPYNMWTKAAPFDSLNCADIGDIPINTFDLKDSVKRIEGFYDELLLNNVIPMALGGDHTLTLPILRSLAKKHGPVSLVHIDAHADVNDHMFGEKIAHGTPFRRAYEEGLVKPELVFQIGLRGTGTEFVKKAIENNLLIIPGNVFSSVDTHFRISYAAEETTLQRGVEVLKKIAAG